MKRKAESLLELPDEIWCNVFSFFTKPELSQIARVSKKFNRLSHDKVVVKNANWPAAQYWDLTTVKYPSPIEVAGVTTLSNEKLVVATGCDLLLWDIQSGKLLNRLSGHQNKIECLSSIFNHFIVSGARDNTLRIWDADSGKCIQTLTGHFSWITQLGVLAGNCIVSSAADCSLRIWDWKKGKCLLKKEQSGWISALVVLKNNCIVSNADFIGNDPSGKNICIWNWQENIYQILYGHTSRVSCINVLPNGNLVSTAQDKTLRMWDSKTGECLLVFNRQIASNHAIVVIENDLVAIEVDKGLAILDLSTNHCLQIFKDVSPLSLLKGGHLLTLSGYNALCKIPYICAQIREKKEEQVHQFSP